MSESEQSTIISSLPVLLERIRAQRPLVHHITNMVVMNDTANITLGIGASPVMAHALEEVEEMVRLAGALVLNIGTLTPEQIEAMLRAGKRANELGIPIVLVGWFGPGRWWARRHHVEVPENLTVKDDVVAPESGEKAATTPGRCVAMKATWNPQTKKPMLSMR